MPSGASPGKAGRNRACPPRHAINTFLEARSQEQQGWEPRRGELVLIYVRTGIRLRGIYVSRIEHPSYGVWANVIAAGRVRCVDRVLVRPYRPQDETATDGEILRSIGWTS